MLVQPYFIPSLSSTFIKNPKKPTQKKNINFKFHFKLWNWNPSNLFYKTHFSNLLRSHPHSCFVVLLSLPLVSLLPVPERFWPLFWILNLPLQGYSLCFYFYKDYFQTLHVLHRLLQEVTLKYKTFSPFFISYLKWYYILHLSLFSHSLLHIYLSRFLSFLNTKLKSKIWVLLMNALRTLVKEVIKGNFILQI